MLDAGCWMLDTGFLAFSIEHSGIGGMKVYGTDHWPPRGTGIGTGEHYALLPKGTGTGCRLYRM
jgi:hypothetical protein